MIRTTKYGLAAAALLSSITVPVAHSATADDAKTISRLYTAAFGRYPDKAGLNFWIEKYDGGTPLQAISQRFIASPEFNETYGELTNREYVEALYLNVLGREGASGGIEFWTGTLDDGRADRANVLSGFSRSPENVAGTAAIFNTVYEEANGDWCFDIDGDGSADNIRYMYWTISDWGRANWN